MDAKTLGVHAACVVVIVACFVLAGTVLRGQPLLGWCTVGAGAWLWGKLGFKPAQAILERIVFKQIGVELVDAKRIVESLRPPAGVGDLFGPAPAKVPALTTMPEPPSGAGPGDA